MCNISHCKSGGGFLFLEDVTIVVWEGERMSCSENSLLETGGVAGAGQP